jgi:hypothetical protein
MQAIAPSDVLARSFCTVLVLAMIAGNCTALSSSPSPEADPSTSPSEEQQEPQARLPNARVEKLVAAQNRNVQAYECAEEFRFSALMSVTRCGSACQSGDSLFRACGRWTARSTGAARRCSGKRGSETRCCARAVRSTPTVAGPAAQTTTAQRPETPSEERPKAAP